MPRPTKPGPKFLAMLGPVLKAVRDLGGSARPQEVYERVSESLRMTAEEKSALTPSGSPRHENQMQWARFYLVRAGLLDSSKRGVWSLTEQGSAVTDFTPTQAQELFRRVREETAAEPTQAVDSAANPSDEQAAPDDATTTSTPSDYRRRAIEVLQALPPPAFERFCQRLLREAGFQNVEVTGQANDGGIDGTGILQLNTLVSFRVLFQCKRYKGTAVTPSQVRDFRGAMGGRADKGIILTTGGFTLEAKKEAVRDGVPPIELVDGDKLVTLLEELEMGLVPVRTFRVDEPFFATFGNVVGESTRPAKD